MVSSAEDKKNSSPTGVKDLQEREEKYNALVFKVLKIAIAAAAVVGILLVVFVFTPNPAKKSFKQGIKALEEMRIDDVMDFISADYSDDSGNTREMFRQYMPIVFERFKEIKVKIDELDVEFDDEQLARIIVEGSVFMKRPDDSLMRFKTEDPAVFFMKKEDKKWRLIHISNMDFNIEELENAESMF